MIHHQGVGTFVAGVGERLDIGVHLDLQRLSQHPPGSRKHDLIRTTEGAFCRKSRGCDYSIPVIDVL